MISKDIQLIPNQKQLVIQFPLLTRFQLAIHPFFSLKVGATLFSFLGQTRVQIICQLQTSVEFSHFRIVFH